MFEVRVHALVACLLRTFLLTKRLLFGFTGTILLGIFIFPTPYSPRSFESFFALAAAFLVLVPVYAAISARASLNRDGWLDDRPRATVLPVSAAEYIGSIVGMSFGGSCVVAVLATSILFAGSRIIARPDYFGGEVLLLAGVDLVLAAALATAQTFATLILRRFDPAPIVLAGASLLVGAARVLYGVFLDNPPTIAISLSTIGGGILLLGGALSFFWGRTVRAFRDPYPN
ncbi:MAG: hypothetical protein WBX15_18180 [Thermoanaerobaculia bacterium]